MALTPIPKIIHFVWAGGGMIPAERQGYISTWPRKNPGWEFRVWYDYQNLLTDVRNKTVREYYGQEIKSSKGGKTGRAVPHWVWSQLAGEIGKGSDDATIDYLTSYHYKSETSLREQRMRTFDELFDFCDRNGLGLHNINDLGHFPASRLNNLYHQEMVGNPVMGTNYGATSDMLRILILLEHGGLYVDSDVFCVQTLDQITAHEDRPRYGITSPSLTECYGKTAAGLSSEQWQSPDFWMERFAEKGIFPDLTNSLIAAHRNSIGLKEYKRRIIKNYKEAETWLPESRFVSPATFRSETVRKSGPTAAAEASKYRDAVGQAHDNYLELYRNHPGTKEAEAAMFNTLIDLRDNIYFPMYHVVDVYGHEWLKEK